MRFFQERFEAITGAKSTGPLLVALAIICIGFAWEAIQTWLGARMIVGAPPWAWGLIIGFAIIAIAFLEYIVRLRRRFLPSMVLAYDDASPDCRKEVLYTSGEKGRSIRAKVECATDAWVEKCQGILVKIEYRTFGGGFSDIPLHEPTYLHWAMEEPMPFDPLSIYPSVPRYLGIVGTREDWPGFRIRTRARSLVTPEEHVSPGEYRIHIRVVAAGSAPLAATLLITWNGKWNEIRASLVKN
jgi:hypothetical protein